MYVSFKQMQFGPETLRCRLPPKIANCQINSIFHLAKHISEFFSYICEDGWECSHISHYVLQQMLDVTACKKILNAGYISPNHTSCLQVSIRLLIRRHMDTSPYICANLETKAAWRMGLHFVHPCGRILSHILKWTQCYIKIEEKRKERRLDCWAGILNS